MSKREKGDVRLFSLGIGRDVSHALIDGLARVGCGFSQVVSDEREGSKVARMLRGALSAHVVNYRLEWEGKQSTEVVKLQSSPSPITRALRRTSLFDSQANTGLARLIFGCFEFQYPQRDASAVQDSAPLPILLLHCICYPLFRCAPSLARVASRNHGRRRRVGTGDCCAEGPCAGGDDPSACCKEDLAGAEGWNELCAWRSS